MHVGKCFVDAMTVGDRLRSIDPEKVAMLADSIAAIGLQQPISVWSPDENTLDLVAGRHRFEAVKKLGWEEIDCIFVDLDDLDRQLWEIDENLMRAELGPAETATHLKRRKELFEAKGGKSSPTLGGEQKIGFAKDTEAKTGTLKRTTNQALARATAIPPDVMAKIAGTDLDKGTYLDKLRKLDSHDEMRERVDRDLAKIERSKTDARLREEEIRRKEEAKEERRRDFADMGELLDKRLSSEECDWFLNALAKYAGKTANDLRSWTNT